MGGDAVVDAEHDEEEPGEGDRGATERAGVLEEPEEHGGDEVHDDAEDGLQDEEREHAHHDDGHEARHVDGERVGRVLADALLDDGHEGACGERRHDASAAARERDAEGVEDGAVEAADVGDDAAGNEAEVGVAAEVLGSGHRDGDVEVGEEGAGEDGKGGHKHGATRRHVGGVEELDAGHVEDADEDLLDAKEQAGAGEDGDEGQEDLGDVGEDALRVMLVDDGVVLLGCLLLHHVDAELLHLAADAVGHARPHDDLVARVVLQDLDDALELLDLVLGDL